MRWVLEGPGWRCAYAIWTLAGQLDAIWPRGGVTDGTIGDAAHLSRTSDHNPREIDGYTLKIVFAIDVHETVEGQGEQLVAALVASRDPRIRYIIHEGKIWRSYRKPGIAAWTAAPYTGPNPHAGHVHISMDRESDVWDWFGHPWDLGELEGEDMRELIAELQAALIDAGYDLGGFTPLDDRFPPGADGEVGDLTRQALREAFEQARFPIEHVHPVAAHTHRVQAPVEWDVVTGVPI